MLAMKKRGFGKGLWNGVGGKLEPGESVEQTLVRETEEEIMVTPKQWRQVAEHSFSGTDKNGVEWGLYGYVFFCEKWEGEPAETDEMAPQWFAINKIPYEQMWQDDEFWLPQVLSGAKAVGKFTFDATDRLLTHSVDIVASLPYEDEGV